jgi:thiamine-phosphate pyrophosphorylase
MTSKIQGGLYLVVDPKPGLQVNLSKIKSALEGGVDVIQIWDNWGSQFPQEEFILAICDLAHKHDVPVLINNHWESLEKFPLDGIHFDAAIDDLHQIKKQIGRKFFVGITCGNDQGQIDWAINNEVDYISFCSMFRSSTSNSCELVRPDTVSRVRAITDMPIFVSGGITIDNLPSLIALGIDGVAIVSEIMKAGDPQLAAARFKNFFSNQTLKNSNP